jgi:hypothetical protein
MGPVTEPRIPRYPFALVIPAIMMASLSLVRIADGLASLKRIRSKREGFEVHAPPASVEGKFGQLWGRVGIGNPVEREGGPEGRLRTVSHLEGHAGARERAPGRRINSLNNSAPLIAYRHRVPRSSRSR